MTTYTAIPDSDIDTDSPVTQSLMTLLRNNPLAMVEGASGAPRIKRAAFDATVLLLWPYDYGNGSDGAKTVSADENITLGAYNYTTYVIDATKIVTVTEKICIIRATTSITINGKINAAGLGQGGRAARTSPGDGVSGNDGTYGGSSGAGGGADDGSYSGGDGGSVYNTAGGTGSVGIGGAGSAQSTNGKRRRIDFGDITIGSGAGGGSGAVGTTSSGGGGSGGAGGGCIVLIAPIVTIGSAGELNASGLDGGNGSGNREGGGGGGGGGAIIIATPSGGYSVTAGGVVSYAGGAGGTAGSSAYAGGAGATGWLENIIV